MNKPKVDDEQEKTKKLVQLYKDLAIKGITEKEARGLLDLIKNPDIAYEKVTYTFSDNRCKIGIIGDTHLTNKFSRLDVLYALYAWFVKEKVDFVIHAGDITDGEYDFRGQERILHAIGINDAADYVKRIYPKTEFKTLFIKGNHDFSFERYRGGGDVCKLITSWTEKEIKSESGRRDLAYLTNHYKIDEPYGEGRWEGDILIGKNENCLIKVLHPDKGYAKGQSYQIENIIGSDLWVEKPKILILGHWHKIAYIDLRNIHGFEAGTTLNTTPFFVHKNIESMLGGWIIDVGVRGDGTIDWIKRSRLDFENDKHLEDEAEKIKNELVKDNLKKKQTEEIKK